MSIKSAEFTPPTLIPSGCRNCGGPCYLHTTDSTGIHRVKCGRGLDAACGYCGPFSSRKDEAIRLHNLLCAPAVQATADAAREIVLALNGEGYIKDLSAWTGALIEQNIAAIIRKAVSPKAGTESEYHAMGCAGRNYLRIAHVGDACTCGIYQPASPPAVSAGEQDKEL